MAARLWVPVSSGPLAPYAAGYGSWLTARGFSRWTVAHRLWQLDLLSRWLEREGLSPGELTLERVRDFLAARRAAGYSTWLSDRSMALPLEYLRELGVVPAETPAMVVEDPLERLLADYGRYLLDERGLTEHTVFARYVPAARLFLSSRVGADISALERLGGADVSLFFVAECAKRSVSAARDLTGGLRSFLRYLYLTGAIPIPLVWAVPTIADLRDSSLPRGLERAVVKRLLSSCDRRRTVGRRDHAILLLLFRLGLRAGEVAAITLDDIDWRAGELLVRNGKGRRQERLPLPADVGEAIVSYLRRRPRTGERALFLRVVAPAGAIRGSAVSGVVRLACKRAGVSPSVGSHALRHTAAIEMLRAGATLQEIGEVLRHQEPRTTARYAKQDAQAACAAVAARRCGMTSLRETLADYLRIRRRLGFKLEWDQRILETFVDFLEQAGALRITSELAVMWAMLPQDAHPHWWSRRLGVVRGFARYLATLDPNSEIPSVDLLAARRARVAPYIYSPEEIDALMRAAGQLTPPMRAAVCRTVIGLMATTGLRLGEALGLDRHDVDLHDGALHVRAGKTKQREVPLHPTATRALREYARQRDRRWPNPSSAAFFLNTRGHRMAKHDFNAQFAGLIKQVGLEGAGERIRPRPHDLRHTMAVRTLREWIEAGEDVDRRMPELSTFLGHVRPESTYWYLQAVPELMALIAARLGRLPEVLR